MEELASKEATISSGLIAMHANFSSYVSFAFLLYIMFVMRSLKTSNASLRIHNIVDLFSATPYFHRAQWMEKRFARFDLSLMMLRKKGIYAKVI